MNLFTEYDFNEEYTDDEEVATVFDSLFEDVQFSQKDGVKIQIMNPENVKRLLRTYKALKYITQGSGVKISYELNEPFNSMGSVTLCGKNIVFKNPEWFVKVVEYASNFEVYPKIDGTIEMNFTFHGLTTSVEE